MLILLKSFKRIIYFWWGLGVIPFVLVCLKIYQKQYPQIDSTILDIFAVVRTNSQLNWIFRLIYLSGGTYIAGTISLIALVIMIKKRYQQEAKIFAFTSLGILLLVDKILKPFFDRPRPPKPRLVEDLSPDSFPSGHAAGNLTLYFYLSFVIATQYPQFKTYVYGISTIIVFLIGFASIYTQAHWFNDVIAGYIFGYLWLILSLTLLKLLQKNYKKNT